MAEPFKNLFDAGEVRRLSERLRAFAGDFDAMAFEREVLDGLGALELKTRVQRISEALHRHLPGDYPAQLATLLRLQGPPADLSKKNQFDFRLWPVTDFVGRFGTSHFEPSLDALHQLTQRFSGEFAIRPFLRAEAQRTLAVLERWTADPSAHVRRLVSEGTRPRLPWGGRLRAFQEDPTATLALLERLRDDPHPYVRRSVANHLGDIAKDHPERAIGTLLRWRAEVGGPNLEWIVRQALRHPIKQGHPGALRAVGRDPDARVSVRALEVPERIALGEALDVRAVLRNEGSSALEAEVDLVVHFVRKNGSRGAKAFKGRVVALPPGVDVAFHKRIPLRPVTTRTHHPGLHRVDLQLNGRILAGADFELTGVSAG